MASGKPNFLALKEEWRKEYGYHDSMVLDRGYCRDPLPTSHCKQQKGNEVETVSYRFEVGGHL